MTKLPRTQHLTLQAIEQIRKATGSCSQYRTADQLDLGVSLVKYNIGRLQRLGLLEPQNGTRSTLRATTKGLGYLRRYQPLSRGHYLEIEKCPECQIQHCCSVCPRCPENH